MTKEEFYSALTLRREIDINGTVRWYNRDGQQHREDGPAVEYSSGSKSWYSHGLLHCSDGPAYEHVHGTKEWWVNGKRHREDGPAVMWADGTIRWFLNGKEFEPF